ncbi:MAG: LCP family protein [Chloroflexota bacterium]
MSRMNSSSKTSFTTDPMVRGLLIAFLIAASVTAYLAFVTARDLVAQWSFTNLPGAPVLKTSTPEQNETGGPVVPSDEPLQPVTGPTPEAWDKASRVTILVMGLDYRDWEAGEGPPRTDTMILFTVDPVTNTAGMLSIPRDLWVNIPGFGYGKINTAYQLGEAFQLPGGGPGLAIETVKQLLGVSIQFYAQIDFSAFVRFIDEIGGVLVDVPEKITIDLIGDGRETIKKLKPGLQVLPGDHALAYARARNTEGSDFDRAQRQHQIILAIRDRILNLNMAPTLIAKAPTLYRELSSGIHTNLSLDQAIKLALLVQGIPEENIKRGIIGPGQVTFGISPDGLDILKPIPDEIRLLRDEIFSSPGVANPVINNMSSKELLQAEDAKISVRNGTYTAGLAASTAEFLQEQGVIVAEITNADQLYTTTTIIDYTGNPYTVEFLVELMNINHYKIFNRYDPESSFDIVLYLGNDWAQNNPMP